MLGAAGKEFLIRIKGGKATGEHVCSDLHLLTFSGIVMPGVAASVLGS